LQRLVGLPKTSDWRPLEIEIERIDKIIAMADASPDILAMRPIITIEGAQSEDIPAAA
jgi:hypothetical protein